MCMPSISPPELPSSSPRALSSSSPGALACSPGDMPSNSRVELPSNSSRALSSRSLQGLCGSSPRGMSNNSPRGLPRILVLHIMRELVTALAHIHSKGIVHRDIRPEHVLMDAAGAVKLCGFSFGENAELCKQMLLVTTYASSYMTPSMRHECTFVPQRHGSR